MRSSEELKQQARDYWDGVIGALTRQQVYLENEMEVAVRFRDMLTAELAAGPVLRTSAYAATAGGSLVDEGRTTQ